MKQLRVVTEENGRYPMGLTVTKKRFHVSVKWAGESCSLVLFERGKEEPWQKFAMDPEKRQGDVWNLTLESDGVFPVQLEYCFEMDGTRMADPYGRMILGWERWGDPENIQKELRSPVWEEDFDWEEDKLPGIPYEDCIIYRTHVRGLTKHGSSRVREKGTFRAVMEKIPYLQELGITTLELMPVMEFQEIVTQGGEAGTPYGERAATGQINYWGYGEGFYFAPKAAYSSGKKKNPVRELKTLVRELHKAGIELVVELYFKGTEDPSFVLDVVRFWVQEYHLDGVHLVGFAPLKLIGQDPYLSRTKLFATSWEGVDKGKMRHLAEYNDGFLVDMRRLLKGDEDQMNNLVFRNRQNPQDCGIINYMANTNGFTMMDMVSYDVKCNEANGENNQDGTDYNFSWNCGQEGPTKRKKVAELRKKQLRNAALILFLSQGTPLLLGGDEFGNSKSGNNNAYCQDNDVSWLNWNLLKTNQDFHDFVKDCIAFRKSHPLFHMAKPMMGMDYLGCGHPDVSYHGVKAWRPEFENFRRQLGILYCGEYGKMPDGSRDDYFFVMYNMHWEPHEFGMPKLPRNRRWHVVVDTGRKETMDFFQTGQEPELEDQMMYQAEARSVIVLIGKVHPELEKEPKSRKKKARRDEVEALAEAEKTVEKAETVAGMEPEEKAEMENRA